MRKATDVSIYCDVCNASMPVSDHPHGGAIGISIAINESTARNYDVCVDCRDFVSTFIRLLSKKLGGRINRFNPEDRLATGEGE